MHLGIICPPVPGHLQPMFTIGRELRSRGHKVTLFSMEDVRTHAEKATLDFAPIGIKEFPEGALEDYLKLIQDVDLSTIREGIKWARRMSIALCRDVSEAIPRLKIDALLVDQSQCEGATISELAHVPFISICNALDLDSDATGDVPPPFLPWSYADGKVLKRVRNRAGHKIFALMMRPIVKTIDKFRVSRGLPPLGHWEETMSKLAVICNMTRGFDYNRTHRKRPFYYTGPYLDEHRAPVPFPYERLDGRPLVYASMGTLHTGKEKVHRAITEACATLPVQLVMSMGNWHADEGDIPEFAGDPIIVSFAPQLELMRRAAMVITHAGLNTVMEALANACPLIAIPITSDQPSVAGRVRRSGTGEVLPIKKVSVERLRPLIEKLLHDSSYKERALAIQAEILAAGGLKAAADIIEEVLQAHAPAPSAAHIEDKPQSL